MSQVQTTQVHPDQVYSVMSAADLLGMSLDTLQRLWKSGAGPPKKTQISARRIGVRGKHLAEYLDDR